MGRERKRIRGGKALLGREEAKGELKKREEQSEKENEKARGVK